MQERDNGNPQVVLNFITPHQKWGIHSTYTDNLLMLTLSRGGPIIWISEHDAATAGIADNDWVEAYNRNGALVAARSEEHTSELQSLMRISYAVFCLKKKKITTKEVQRSKMINSY